MNRGRALLYPAFFLSGACGLVYQVIWVRQLSLLLGNTTEAVATVLAAFMLGLSLGSAVAGRWADRTRRPLLFYAALEVGIGGTALAATHLFDSLGPAYRTLAQALGAHPLAFAVVRFVFAFATVTVPTALMGATLPVVARARLSPDQPSAVAHVGGEVGRLYALNTLGAALGCAAAGFWALGRLGLHRTALVAAVGNVAIGAWIAILARSARAAPAATRPEERAPEAASAPGGTLGLTWLAVIASGFIGLSLEGIWTRVLQFSVGSTVYAFSLMLTVFLLGLALGSLVISRVADRLREPTRTLGWLAIAHGAAVVACLLWFLPAADFIGGLAPRAQSFALWASLVGLALMGLPTLLLGTIFPLGTRIAASLAARVGRDVGTLYMLNTLGAIAGSLATAFLAIPILGTETSLLVLSLASVAVGSLLLARTTPARALVAAGFAAAAVALAVASGGSSRARILMPLFSAARGRDESPEPVFFREGRASTVSVHRYEGFRNQGALRLYTNGSSMTGTFFDGQRYMKLLGHLPVLLSPTPERVLTICFGTGMTFGATALHSEVKEARAAELSATVLEAAPLFKSANGDVLARRNARVVIGDGRQVLLASRELFDVITAEPPPPRQAGTYQLYSREFYQLARERLTPDGILAQWLPLHDQSELEVRMAVRSFVEVFPNAQLWLPHATEGILLGSPGPLAVDRALLVKRWAEPEVAASLRSIGFDEPAALLKTFVMGAAELAHYARSAPPITDDRPLTDFYLGLPPFMEPRDVEALLAHSSPSYPLPEERIVALTTAHRAYVEGVVHNVRDRIYEAHLAAPEDSFYSDTLSISPWQRENLERALAANPNDVRLHLDRARVALNAHEYDRAVSTLETVTRGAPQLAMGWFNLGWALEMRGDLAEAERAYHQAPALDAGLSGQVESRLAALAAAGALARRSENPDASLAATVEALASNGRGDLALEAARLDVAERPDALDSRLALLRLLTRTGRHDEAESVLAAARKQLPDDPELVLAGARHDLATGRFERVVESLRDGAPGTGDASRSSERCLLRAHALRELGRLDEAHAAYGCARVGRAADDPEIASGEAMVELGRGVASVVAGGSASPPPPTRLASFARRPATKDSRAR